MTRTLALIGGTALIGLLSTTAYAQGAGTQKGMDVFVAQKCSVCHSIAGKGKKNAPLDDVGSRLTAAEIKAWILDPVAMAEKREPKSTRKPPMKKKAMPAGDVDALVALLTSLKK
jgi:hypothetical protein